AQYSLGRLYLDGREDFSPDTRQAERWLTLSAEQGNQFAQYSLGRLYLDGKEDFSPDTRQAEKWLTLSAEQGNQFAQYSLGKLYYYGRGIVAPDPGKAYLWLSRSAEQGNFFAKVLLEKEAYQYQTVKRKVTHNIGYLISKLSRYLNNEQEKKRSIMLYEQMEQQLQAELEQ
ncbi:MAG: sel1 repeat family protein, partial [Clostridiaceae bacterium]|nr:sel1 repeat family protein [Clostridiaceae bacterium]